MDVELYDRWRAALALLILVANAEADVTGSRTVSQEEAFAAAEAAIRQASQ